MDIILNILMVGTLIFAIFTITSINPINSVVGLIIVYVNIALLLIGLSLNFIGLSYLIIYVGAIAILFLFVVMMMNIKYIELSEVNKEYTKILPLGAIIGILFILELSNSILIPLNEVIKSNKNDIIGLSKDILLNMNVTISYSTEGGLWDSLYYSISHIENLGHALYSYGLLWLILGSLILLLAMISPIILCFDKNMEITDILSQKEVDVTKLVNVVTLEVIGKPCGFKSHYPH